MSMQAKPENVLKRARDIINIPTNEEVIRKRNKRAALQLLHDVLESRKKVIWQKTHEDVMLLYLEICVELQLSLEAKDGLHQYRNISQQQNPGSLEVVINHLIKLAENRVSRANKASTQVSLAAAEIVDDLEASQTPESIMLSTITDDAQSDRISREMLVPWLKFLWETYRTVLEILKNNSKLDHLYHQTCVKAFNFCRTYHRRTEFRRLCDILRTHLTHLQNYANQVAAGTNVRPLRGWEGWTTEAIELHLQTRFTQLEVATEMELWTEGFRTIEDIHGIMGMTRKSPKISLMATYYERLTQIFWVSENYVFHAYAWFKFYLLSRSHNTKLTQEKLRTMSSAVVLATLSIPVSQDQKDDGKLLELDDIDKEKNRRMMTLLGLTNLPKREHLLNELVTKNILEQALPEVQELYHQLAVKFHPLNIVEAVKPGLAFLRKQSALVQYVQSLEKLLVQQLLHQLATVYDSVRIDRLESLLKELHVEFHDVEKLIVGSVKGRRMRVRIDHRSRCLHFGADVLESAAMKDQLSELGRRLLKVVAVIAPEGSATMAKKDAERRQLFTAVRDDLDEEHARARSRKEIIEKRKEELERLQQERAKAEARRLAELEQYRREQEKQRLEKEARMREREKLQAIKAEIAMKETKKMLKGLGKAVDTMGDEDLEAVDKVALLRESREKAKRAREEAARKVRDQAKRLDYITRATREEERPILIKRFEEQRAKDRAEFEAAQSAFLKQHREEWEHGKEEKKRLAKMVAFRGEFEAARLERRRAEYEAKAAEHAAKLRIERLQKKLERAYQRREEHEEELRREEEERERQRQQEEAERAEEERIRREAEEAEQIALKAAEEDRRRREEMEAAKARAVPPPMEEEREWRRPGASDVGDRYRRGPPPEEEDREWRRGPPSPQREGRDRYSSPLDRRAPSPDKWRGGERGFGGMRDERDSRPLRTAMPMPSDEAEDWRGRREAPPVPPRKRFEEGGADAGPPRRRFEDSGADAGPPRRRFEGSDADAGPPRRRFEDGGADAGPPRRRFEESAAESADNWRRGGNAAEPSRPAAPSAAEESSTWRRSGPPPEPAPRGERFPRGEREGAFPSRGGDRRGDREGGFSRGDRRRDEQEWRGGERRPFGDSDRDGDKEGPWRRGGAREEGTGEEGGFGGPRRDFGSRRGEGGFPARRGPPKERSDDDGGSWRR